MAELLVGGLTPAQTVLIAVCIAFALGFEFVNGFHDTANAVATVIYTNSLRPWKAVILSGLCNFLGVFVGGIAVAMGIIKLIPTDLLVQSGPGVGLAMVLALLFSATLWNVGTWYLGLPSSSSHTLIGSILGVGLAYSMLPGQQFGSGVNWSKAEDIGLSLLMSPVFGFGMAALVLMFFRKVVRSEKLLTEPEKDTPPPTGIRALLIMTCSGVSFAHGSNDGQKGVGLVMLILMGLLPTSYALDATATRDQVESALKATTTIEAVVKAHSTEIPEVKMKKVVDNLTKIREIVGEPTEIDKLPQDSRFPVRKAILVADKGLDELKSAGLKLSKDETATLTSARKSLRLLTDYAPTWVLVAIALSLGLGTMIGWKRIVITIGEKIGKTHLTYAQGASAELVAASTIGVSAWLGLPVSTTHVLSSGIAGTMVANKAGVQGGTVKKIVAAWVLTLPASMFLSCVFFHIFRLILG